MRNRVFEERSTIGIFFQELKKDSDDEAEWMADGDRSFLLWGEFCVSAPTELVFIRAGVRDRHINAALYNTNIPEGCVMPFSGCIERNFRFLEDDAKPYAVFVVGVSDGLDLKSGFVIYACGIKTKKQLAVAVRDTISADGQNNLVARNVRVFMSLPLDSLKVGDLFVSAYFLSRGGRHFPNRASRIKPVGLKCERGSVLIRRVAITQRTQADKKKFERLPRTEVTSLCEGVCVDKIKSDIKNDRRD
ncbi:hypothetical protein EVAR_209_1 [Eumeta japonica]|uniref:Uncharacterized protein n=1 Tax=Eumeta variegata TaxID=151549 RepID=A0A4C1SBE3_EUMVA|nr:hypothetical protein EVAR_209_1 [Eumeta japonica]